MSGTLAGCLLILLIFFVGKNKLYYLCNSYNVSRRHRQYVTALQHFVVTPSRCRRVSRAEEEETLLFVNPAYEEGEDDVRSVLMS